MADFKISSHPLNNVSAVVKLAGELDAAHFDAIMDELEKLINSGILGVVLDLSDATSICCPALGAFVHASRTLRNRNGKLVAAGPKDMVLRLVEMVGLREIVDVAETVDQARQLVSSLR